MIFNNLNSLIFEINFKNTIYKNYKIYKQDNSKKIYKYFYKTKINANNYIIFIQLKLNFSKYKIKK